MKKFTFELEDVLKFRKFEEEQAQAELGKAIAVETEIENNLKQIAMQYASLNQQMAFSKDVQDIISHNQYKNLLNFQKEELLKQLAEAKLVTEEKRQVLAEIMKKTTALNKLKEKQLEDYKNERKLAEQKQMDEMNSKRIIG